MSDYEYMRYIFS